VTTLPGKTNTTASANIGVKCFVLLTKLISRIKMMRGCSSQVAMLDVSAAILDNSFKTSTPLTDRPTVISETL